MIRATIDEAATHLHELVQAALRGEDVFVTVTSDDGEYIVQLIPNRASSDSNRMPQFGHARGEIWMADDFNDPLEDFAEYMQ
jgi:antitoxin (DNA-binding transcriptional repressor) of toxin-antitoxin stability system